MLTVILGIVAIVSIVSIITISLLLLAFITGFSSGLEFDLEDILYWFEDKGEDFGAWIRRVIFRLDRN